MPQMSKIEKASSTFCSGEINIKQLNLRIYLNTLPLIFLHNSKMSTANILLARKHIRASFMTQLFAPNPQMKVNTIFHPKPPSLGILYFHHKYHKL